MKHIKTYQIFENIDTIINDFRDILLELSDDRFNIQVKKGNHHAYSKSIEITISKDGGDFDFWTERNIITFCELTPFNFGEVKESLLRLLSYADSDADSERWHHYNFDIVTSEKLHNCLDSKRFLEGTYKTPIKIKGDEIVNSYYSFKTSQVTDTPIEDDVKILCIYIGLGK